MNEKIIAKYELIVFDSGRTEIKPIIEQSESDYSACSSRIRQVLSVIKKMKNYRLYSEDLNEIYSKSISDIAATFQVEQSTIADKMTRQLGKNAAEIRQIVFDYIDTGSTELKKLLINNIGKNTKDEDTKAINETLI